MLVVQKACSIISICKHEMRQRTPLVQVGYKNAMIDLTYLKNMRPLFPTLATVNCRPSRPAEVPSGAMLALSPLLSFLELVATSPPDFLSTAGTKCLVLLAGERPPPLLLPPPPRVKSDLLVSRREWRGGERRLNLASRTAT